MIDRQRLLSDLKPLLKEIEADLRARCDEASEIDANLNKEYEQARAADRTGVTYEEWRADLITQVAVAWVLSAVFVRFLEDNALFAPPRISGPLHGAGTDAGLMRARDERETYFKTHAKQTDRDYLLAVFEELSALPGTRDVFGAHNAALAYRNWLSGDAAQKLIEFFQKIDADSTGEIVHDFTDPHWETRFLGDLYQDLSEAARKKYALLQTPIFVEEFILQRTLEPAIKEFGLKDFKMIDPACGSGHFLLGSFARILSHWRAKEPGAGDRELVNRTLASVYGVDLNPYAIAIARFRLLLVAMRECHVEKLADAPAFAFNLVCGDSLLHGKPMQQGLMDFHELAHVYKSEDLPELERILAPGAYHAVVANPPYITVKDKALNVAYRERYPEVCHMKYSLSVPFIQRLNDLNCPNGFSGQITSNSFMKREFGKKLIEVYLPKWDLTHVIDSAGAYLPGFGTPTVILFGRNRKPVAPTIRTAMGITGEPATPADPARGLVWTAIVDQLDQPGSQSRYISVNDSPREAFHKHPWSIGGGGASELRELLDEAGTTTLRQIAEDIGPASFAGIDDVFVGPSSSFRRFRVFAGRVAIFCAGDHLRDWGFASDEYTFAPYDSKAEPIALTPGAPWARRLWPFRRTLESVVTFGKRTRKDCGDPWWTWYRWIANRVISPLKLSFAFVATSNHFMVNRGTALSNRSAPVIQLSGAADEDSHLELLGVLNSSTACFWLKQSSHNKGSTVDQHGARQRTAPFEDFWEFTSTQLESFPLPVGRPLEFARRIDALARAYADSLPEAVCQRAVPDAATLAGARERAHHLRGQMIALQEELDWQCYHLYGLADETYQHPKLELAIELGQRAFEIVLARQMAAGEVDTTWFARHGSTPITEMPKNWPAEYRAILQRRIDLIESDKNIGLIEKPEYKRRWNTEPWDEQQARALKGWLLDRLESHFDLDGRMNGQKKITATGDLHAPKLTSVAKVSDIARADREFMQVAEVYSGRMDFDVGTLVAELMTAESVPALPVLRYKRTALDKRRAWERTWDLQRLEDAVDAVFDVESLRKIDVTKAEQALGSLVAALRIDEQAKPGVLSEAVSAAGYLAQAVNQKLNLDDDVIQRPINDAANRAKKATVGEIPVPPKYTSADFLSGNFWRLRGKLDVPKERWVSFPHCEGDDGTLVIAWAGYDHLQLARAIAERFELAKESEGRQLVPLLAAIGQLIPWLKQWHNDIDPAFGTRMGDYFAKYLAEEAKAIGQSVEQVMAWLPPDTAKGRGRKKTRVVTDEEAE